MQNWFQRLYTILKAAITVDGEAVELATQAEADAGTEGRLLTADLNKLSIPGAAVATTSGTAHDFTGIPAGVRRIKVMFQGSSSDATMGWRVQIGDSGGLETTGYAGSLANHGANTVTLWAGGGFDMGAIGAGNNASGAFTLTLLDESINLWICEGLSGVNDAAGVFSCCGTKSLSSTLDRVRFTSIAGTATFDAGSVNITYER